MHTLSQTICACSVMVRTLSQTIRACSVMVRTLSETMRTLSEAVRTFSVTNTVHVKRLRKGVNPWRKAVKW